MIELSSEARTAYEVMVSSLEQTGQPELEQAANTQEELEVSSMTKEADPTTDTTQPEEPAYSKLLSQLHIYVFSINCKGKTK